MRAEQIALALLRRLGGDVVISEQELVAAQHGALRISATDDGAFSFTSIHASGVPDRVRRLEACPATKAA